MSSSDPVVAFQGEMGAFSEMAARSYFCENVRVVPQSDFAGLFDAVAGGACTHGMVPIENSVMGSIHENYDLLLRQDLYITGEIKLRIVHNLIVNPGVRMEDVRQIYSQAPALAQCTEFIRSAAGVEAVVAHDTAGAVKQIKEENARDAAAIASAQAAIDYDLEILREGLENDRRNYTRFLVVASEPAEPVDPAKTTVVYSLDHVPGALFKSLGVFAMRNINLLKIESRPLSGRPWEYVFYLDFEGHLASEECRQAIDHLEKMASFLKILGSYALGETVEGSLRKKRVAP
ncbi:MAG: prephenate dehydratase [Gemmatimonadota bacterium]|nr:prephenate dehydratase [Gemmatimonadota bacterium]